MALELYYTSSPKGLKPGSSGFCTVAATAGMPETLLQRLESLSSYQPLSAANLDPAARQPVSNAHWRLSVNGRTRSVLSRVSFAGLDYTRRQNKLGYHLVLNAGEQSPAGPAWLMAQPDVMATAWTPPRGYIPAEKTVPRSGGSARPCSVWEATGNAGGAGALAEAFINDPTHVSYIIYHPTVDPLPMLDEAIALLPPRLRWQVTFSSYFTELPAGLSCAWRCAIAGTVAAKEAPRFASSGVVIDLTRPLSRAPDSFAADAARCGATISAPRISGAMPLLPEPKDSHRA